MTQFSEKKQRDDTATPDPGADGRERVAEILRSNSVSPTSQRISIALELLLTPTHLSAEEIVRRVATRDDNVSRATVYNTLRCFVEHGLVRQVNVGTDRVFYDSNTTSHHHFYDPESGELTDIDSSTISIVGMPRLPEGRELDAVELVIRLKGAESSE